MPGNFYPEERFLRAYMVKSGMNEQGLMGKKNAKCCIAVVLSCCIVGLCVDKQESARADHVAHYR